MCVAVFKPKRLLYTNLYKDGDIIAYVVTHVVTQALVAELVYASDLKSDGFTALWVRVPPGAPLLKKRRCRLK